MNTLQQTNLDNLTSLAHSRNITSGVTETANKRIATAKNDISKMRTLANRRNGPASDKCNAIADEWQRQLDEAVNMIAGKD